MENPEEINKRELMEYYEYEGKIGELKLKHQLLRSWFFQFLASLSPSSNLAVLFQRARGVKIGRHVYLGPNVHLDLLYPQLITIEDFVSIGMNTMIFVHSNPTNSIHIKKYEYPRKIAHVAIKKGTWVAPGCIILAGVTIGEYAVVGAGSLVTKDVPPMTVVVGVPAKPVKELTNIKEIIAINRSKFLHARGH